MPIPQRACFPSSHVKSSHLPLLINKRGVLTMDWLSTVFNQLKHSRTPKSYSCAAQPPSTGVTHPVCSVNCTTVDFDQLEIRKTVGDAVQSPYGQENNADNQPEDLDAIMTLEREVRLLNLSCSTMIMTCLYSRDEDRNDTLLVTTISSMIMITIMILKKATF